MAELTIGSVYGSALFEAAQEKGNLEPMLVELDQLLSAFQETPLLFEYLSMPTIPKDNKKKLIKDCFEGQISQELLNFAFILIDKKRMRYIGEIARFYKQKLDKSKNISQGIIYSVEPLSTEELTAFEEQTATLLRQTVKLKNEIDTSILGGIKIFIEGKVIDATVQKRLHDLSESLSQLAVS
jgi:F-type H+-transporting ATPase subunit delta